MKVGTECLIFDFDLNSSLRTGEVFPQVASPQQKTARTGRLSSGPHHYSQALIRALTASVEMP